MANREMFIPATVTAEAGYLINRLGGPRGEASFLRGVGEGDLVPVEQVRSRVLVSAEAEAARPGAQTAPVGAWATEHS